MRDEGHGIAGRHLHEHGSSTRLMKNAPMRPMRQADRQLHQAAAENQPRHLACPAPSARRTPISCVRCVTE